MKKLAKILTESVQKHVQIFILAISYLISKRTFLMIIVAASHKPTELESREGGWGGFKCCPIQKKALLSLQHPFFKIYIETFKTLHPYTQQPHQQSTSMLFIPV